MSQSRRDLIRWVLLLPGAIIGGFLATFPLHWILYGTLVSGSVVSGLTIEPIERFLSPFVIALAFVLMGTYIAPHNKLRIAVTLTIIYLISFIALFLFISQQATFELRGVGALIGALLGLFIAWKKYKLDLNTPTH